MTVENRRRAAWHRDPEAGSVRRTSHIDITLRFDGSIELSGTAHDLATDASGTAAVVERAALDAVVDSERILRAIEPREARALVGQRVGAGFRAELDARLPSHHARSSPLYLLLDDVPVAALISGYAALHNGQLPTRRIGGSTAKADVCSGWRSDGTMVVSLRRKGVMPVPKGPPAPVPDPEHGRRAWHTLNPLRPGVMRRQRLLDVRPDDAGVRVIAMFRDTHADDTGLVTVLHEYELDARYDPATQTFHGCTANPVVLPWPECTPAAASARVLDGRRAGDLRRVVGKELRGIGSCTHLNDLLRALAAVPTLCGHQDRNS